VLQTLLARMLPVRDLNADNKFFVYGILMVIGIPQKNLSFKALDILLVKYRVMGASSGTRQQMRQRRQP
jgi:hypothetical protein